MNQRKALTLLKDGLKTEFAHYVFEHREFDVLVKELAKDFADTNVPLLDNEAKLEMASMLAKCMFKGEF